MLLGWILYGRMFPAYPAAYERAARNTGQDVGDYATQMRMMTSAESRHVVSDADWSRLVSYLNSRNQFDVANAITSMGDLSGPRRAAAANMLRPIMSRGNPFLTGLVLISLRRLDAPDWRTQAQRYSADPDPLLRRTANQVLGKIPPGE